MTIKELEETLGMTRANIRFYEQEELLSPARTPNGYRDYSQEDVETLKKIKLLRELDVDLETIRALQRGEETLSRILERQLQRLEADEAALAGAKAVCAQLRQEGPDYATLDAGPWLAQLEKAPASERFAPPRDEKPLPQDSFWHPWRRYFARTLDLGLYGLFLSAVFSLGFHVPVEELTSAPARLLLGWFANLPMLLLEPFLLSRWGTTPGKALFGIKVLDSEGQKLSLKKARERTMGVFSKGMGYGIPGFELYREYRSEENCENRQWNEWEICSDTGEPEQMTIPGQSWRCVAYVAARAATFLLAVLIALQSLMPPCRGELDLKDFCQNINFYRRYLSVDGENFTPEGIREEPEPEPGVIVISSLYENEIQEVWSPVEENGETVGFRYTLHARGNFFWVGLEDRQLGVLAYVGSLPETNCVSLVRDGWLDMLEDWPWNFELVHKGVRLTQRAEIRGADHQTGGWLVAEEDDGLVTVDLEFTVERDDTGSQPKKS